MVALPMFRGKYHLGYVLAFVILITVITLSNIVIMPVTLQMLLYSTCIIYIGSHHSLALLRNDEVDFNDNRERKDNEEEEEEEPEHFMSSKDAAMFPVFGSCALCSLYVAYKFFGKEWVNYLLSFYLSIGGWVATGTTLAVVLEAVLPTALNAKMSRKFYIPNNMVTRFLFEEELALAKTDPEKAAFTLSLSNVLAVILSGVNCGLFLYFKHFVPHNILGVCFCIQALALASLNEFYIGFLLLAGLFVYDIFWVFGTDVMVTVAKSFDGPAKIIFPLAFADPVKGTPMRPSILGLGDIVVPGFFIAMVLRFDAFLQAGHKVVKWEEQDWQERFTSKKHFIAVLISYVLSLNLTSVVMFYFNSPQPALLYLCPGISIGLVLSTLFWGDFKKMWQYSESYISSKHGNRMIRNGKGFGIEPPIPKKREESDSGTEMVENKKDK